jgi:GMP synthase-like glutamine amidotransferase
MCDQLSIDDGEQRAVLRLLVADSETPPERERRKQSAGKSAGDSYAATLRQMVPGCEVQVIEPADADAAVLTAGALAAFDGIFLSGSPLHVYCETPEVRRQLAFMRAVFRSGTPSFGSCAGLQVAVAAAGGVVRKMGDRQEAAVARRITATTAGRDHPLLQGRPPSWDALAMHGDEVERLPDCATLLASNAATEVQAAEIRHDRGIFWGVQYHPELAPGEIAAALRRDVASLIENGIAGSPEDVDAQAALLERLHHAPDARPIRWRLGIDGEVAIEERRRTELRNFIDHLVVPHRRRREESQRLPPDPGLDASEAASDADRPAHLAATFV